MNYQQVYREGKEANYSDEEITKYLLENDPDFGKIIGEAEQAGYSPEEVLGHFNPSSKQEEEPGFKEWPREFVKQGAQGLGIGALGTYGDILDLLGFQAKEMDPREKQKYERQAEILDKGKNEPFSINEIRELSDTEESSFFRLPSTNEIEELGKKTGLVSEPKTPAGRYGKRIGKLGGGGLALGGGGIVAPIVAGAAGQTLEEVGAPPWMQAAAEIVASLKFAPNTSVPVTSKTKEVASTIKDLRNAGFTEKDITLAKSALEERKILKKFSSLTPGVENTIQKGIKNSEELFKEQVKQGLPGYAEGGLPYLEKQASNVYGAMEDLASTIPIKNTEPVKKAVQNAIDYLEKYPLLDEQKKFIEFMKDGVNKLEGIPSAGKLAKSGESGITAEFLTGFYRNLGKAGNWKDPKQKEHLLGLVKEGIKETFRESGPDAAKFGKYFEQTNEAWKSWLDARDLMQTIEKAQNIDGMNFKHLSSLLNKPENHELAKKVLGSEQLNNIKTISEGAQAIESLLKQIPKSDKTINTIKIISALSSLIAKDYRPLAVLVGLEAAKRLSNRILTNPGSQNKMKKLIIAAKNNSPQQAAILAQELIDEVGESDAHEKP